MRTTYYDKDCEHYIATVLTVLRLVARLTFCRSNGLFQLWNKYERKMQPQYLAEKLLSTGDSLYRAKVRTSTHLREFTNAREYYINLRSTDSPQFTAMEGT